jgi:DNA primase
MAISPETIEEVRRAVDIVEVIDAVVPLKRAGAYYKALSPFNKEKTPSFMVSRERQSFKCYSSGHGGDVFKFIMLYDNVDFPTAVRQLAERAGVEIREDGRAPDKKVKQRRDQLLSLHADILRHWQKVLLEEGEGEPGRHYLKQRDIPLQWVKEYGLGYAPALWDDSLRWGKPAGYDESLLEEAGLVVRNDRGRIYDRFRDRLIFAIHDEQGQVIGFSARLLDPEVKAAKYVNSPETPLFTKSKVLFGFHRAKRAILEKDRVIVCEGQIDVLRCHSCGILNVVAPLGTSFTEEHARMIRRNTRNVVLCLDADRAGKRAAARAADLLTSESSDLDAMVQSDLGVHVIPLPDGHDPDSLIVDQGAEAFRALAEQPQDYLDFLVTMASEENRDSLSGNRRAIEEVATFLAKVPNRAYREQLVARAALRLDVSTQAIEEEVQQHSRRRRAPGREEAGEVQVQAEELRLDPEILSLVTILLARPEMVSTLQSRLEWKWIQKLEGASFLEKIIGLYNDDIWREPAELVASLEGSEQALVSGIDTTAMEKGSEEEFVRQIDRKCQHLKRSWSKRASEWIATRLRDGSISGEEKARLLKQLTELKRL